MLKDILVSIQCLVYNHEQYLRKCLDGFVMQKTSFAFEVIVHDDASTDNSVGIIREYAEKYPEIIKPIYETENQYSKHDGSLRRIMDTAMSPTSKYIALCEGDDYWTDPYKLQKQVDYLESHPECGLVYTNSMIYDQEKQHLFKASLPKQSDFRGLLLESPIMTLTTCFREDLYKKYLEEIERNPAWLMGDLPLWLFLGSQSDIKYLPDVTSVYRILDNSASHTNDINKAIRFCMSSFEIRKYFANKYRCQELIKQICITHINELFILASVYNQSVSSHVIKLAYKEKVFAPKVWIKAIVYSTSYGRYYYKRKYSS